MELTQSKGAIFSQSQSVAWSRMPSQQRYLEPMNKASIRRKTNFKGKEKLYKLKAAIGVTIINPLDSDFFGSWHFTILELHCILMPVQQMMISLKHLINSELVKAPAE